MALRGIYTIPAGWPFVDALAQGILDEVGTDPVALADVTILLPTRRAVRALREAFLRRSDGAPMLLPRMSPLGDLDEDELAIAADEEIGDSPLDLPPAISGLRRQLLLARLVRASAEMPIEQAAMLAQELARLIDRVATERLTFDRLAAIVPDEYARHWQQTIEFLKIVTEHWPNILKGEGALDAAERRNNILEAETQRWRAAPPKGLIIAAGSTGSIPATADLLATIATLPRGVLVLPGFAPQTPPAIVEAALQDAQHPQHGMLRLLRHLDEPYSRVKLWPAKPANPTHPDRASFLADVMRPAEATDGWHELAKPSGHALAGLSRIDCPGPEEEARIVALLMRETLDGKGKTAALVTPDRNLARRVAAELHRWSIEIDDSAGRPLAATQAGAYLRLVADVVAERFSPIPVLALLKHPLAACGFAPRTLRRLVRDLEISALRGPRPASGIAGLRAALSASRTPTDADLPRLLDTLEAACAELSALHRQRTAAFAALAAAHVRLAETLSASDTQTGAERLWSGDDGEAAAALVAEIVEAAPALGDIPPESYGGLLDALMAGRVVRPRYGTHPRLFIWGLLEARLQHADVMILSGLNEGAWPPNGEADPWMSRPMRAAFGLPPPERRIGLTAHDFAQAMGATDVVLTRAVRADGAPTVPSRWLVKLEKILTKHELFPHERNPADYLLWQGVLDRPTGSAMPRGERRPAPTPPVAARPRRLSVTQIETWMRDPYSIYARHVLKLNELDPIDAAPDGAQYGTIIHDILDEFTARHPNALPARALDDLLVLGRARFTAHALPPGIRAFWEPRFERIARWFVETESERRADVVRIASEVRGEWTLSSSAGDFTLNAVADRIDTMADGTVRIYDYKTGAVPNAKEIAGGYAPQLPLEAVIATAGGFANLPAAVASKLAFLRLSGGTPPGEEKIAGTKTEPGDLAEAAREGLRGLVAAFDRAETPYDARPRPDMAPRYSAYEHLARIKEWAADDDSEGGS